MVPAHFHDVDGDLFDHNVEKLFGLSKILTIILLAFVFRGGLWSDSKMISPKAKHYPLPNSSLEVNLVLWYPPTFTMVPTIKLNQMW